MVIEMLQCFLGGSMHHPSLGNIQCLLGLRCLICQKGVGINEQVGVQNIGIKEFLDFMQVWSVWISFIESASDPYLFAACDSLCYLIDGAPGCHFLNENHIKRVQWRCSFVLLETWLELEKRRNLVILIVAKVEIPKNYFPMTIAPLFAVKT